MNQIDYVLANVALVTANSKLRNYINDCIMYNKGKLRNCPSPENECNFIFKNERGERVYINILYDKIYAFVNRVDGIEELWYKKDDSGVNVSYNSSKSSCIFGNLQTIKTVIENTKYDLDGKLEIHNCHVNESTYINGEIFKELLYTNFDKDISDFIVDDELVRFENHKYDYHPELDRELCYVSDYQDGMFCSLDDVDIIKPKFVPFSGDKSSYLSKYELINKNSVQNVKSMI